MSAMAIAEKTLASGSISKDFLSTLIEKGHLDKDKVAEILQDGDLKHFFTEGKRRRNPPRRNPPRRRLLARLNVTLRNMILVDAGPVYGNLPTQMVNLARAVSMGLTMFNA